MLGLGMRRNDDVAPFEKDLFHISTTVVIPAVVTSHVRFFFLSFLLFSFWLHLFSFRGAFFFPPAFPPCEFSGSVGVPPSSRCVSLSHLQGECPRRREIRGAAKLNELTA
eukprot:GHVU01147828.1.p1 GENE.GHVU01147828.1~~GHVU01147828.1.p1  ORF type:complete len:110 (-),score=4.45 GHVU01147828.1:49-378(-)